VPDFELILEGYFLLKKFLAAMKYLFNVSFYTVIRSWPLSIERRDQGVTKRCRPSLLTNSALVYDPKCGWMGGGVGYGVLANRNSSAHHVTWSSDKLWRSNSIFNLEIGLLSRT
jgi:hypothetical protein